ncbi:Uncharacterised protein [Halioglobus japonicus]|nr:Uncharacterised protein [Halioglobus japonicus]
MKFRTVLILAAGLKIALAGTTAFGGYVVEADGMSSNAGEMVSSANFEFVAHDFGMESKDAIQMALDNLSGATNLQGNLLSWSLSEDYSHYEDAGSGGEDAGGDQAFGGLNDGQASGANYITFTETSAATDAGIQDFSPIDINTIFWILGPTDVTSFSQVTAARFGFDQGE